MRLNRFRLAAALLILLSGTGAVSFGTALVAFGQQPRRTNRRPAMAAASTLTIPHGVRFREVYGRGLLISVWINSAGPYTFAIDTGAGATIVSPRVASEARVQLREGPRPSIAGLSGAVVAANDGLIQTMSLGDSQNYLPAKREVIVSGGLPRDLDGLLDPNDAFGPLGYVIDIPSQQLSAFDPQRSGISVREQPEDGAVVPWLLEGNSHRPFVLLDTGEKALIDTGSSLGLVVRDLYGGSPRGAAVRDVGGSVSARRAVARTVSIGSLVLQNVPTDIISGATTDAPVMLGLNALRPFRLRFDPLHRLIEIAPTRYEGRE